MKLHYYIYILIISAKTLVDIQYTSYLATEPSNIFTLSASAAKALTTALIVLLSLPKSSSLCARRFGFLPILFNLDRKHW